ncbi:High-affinity glucose transporter [Sphaceloma murrayae]|uniref:High-affinity glucose transporter n=1 Tax=Sphaceloma murrayae TaxID=2082308 RepID=A0A2K1QIG7_9PEZI|nr:High-affinity glucose transporter [Sphaceloma murrayae]
MKYLSAATSRAAARVRDDTRLKDVLPVSSNRWWRVGFLLRLNLLLTVPWASAFMNGYDSSMLNGTQSLPIWIEGKTHLSRPPQCHPLTLTFPDFDSPSGSTLGLMVSMSLVGMIAATPFTPKLADYLGRRHPIVIGSIICCGGAALQSSVANLSYFLAGRFLLGLGLGITIGTSTPLIAELAYPSQRAIITSLYNTTWCVGSIATAWITYGTYRLTTSWSWRVPAILQCAPAVYQLFAIYLLPESPRWLISKGRIQQARQVLTAYHAGGDPASALVNYEMIEKQEAIEHERLSKNNSYLDFFRTPGNRWRLFNTVTLGFIVQWSGTGLVSYYLILVLKSVGITNGETQNIINGALQIFNFFVATCAAVSVERLGRRALLLTSITGMFVALVIWTTVSALHERGNFTNSGLGNAVVVMILVFYFFYNMAFNPIPFAYVLEIMPFSLRAKGISIFQASTLGALLFNSFVNPIALEEVGWRYYICFVGLLIVWFGIIYFTFPETKSLSLEQVSEIFDGGMTVRRPYGSAAGGRAHVVDSGDTRSSQYIMEAYELPAVPDPENGKAISIHKT